MRNRLRAAAAILCLLAVSVTASCQSTPDRAAETTSDTPSAPVAALGAKTTYSSGLIGEQGFDDAILRVFFDAEGETMAADLYGTYEGESFHETFTCEAGESPLPCEDKDICCAGTDANLALVGDKTGDRVDASLEGMMEGVVSLEVTAYRK